MEFLRFVAILLVAQLPIIGLIGYLVYRRPITQGIARMSRAALRVFPVLAVFVGNFDERGD